MSEQERQRLANEHWSWIRMIIEQTVFGIIIGCLLAWLVIQYDINRIGTMISHSQHSFGFTALLMFGFAVTGGMATAGAAIWFRAMSDED